MLRRTICLTGRDAAELFYDPERFIRRGAAPEPAATVLFESKGVQSLDGEAHRHRKEMFLNIFTPARVAELVRFTEQEWLHCLSRASRSGQPIVLFDIACEGLCRAVCEWSGIPLTDAEAPGRTRQLSLLFQGAGAKGLNQLRGRLARRRANRWAARLINEYREGARPAPPSSALAMIAAHHDLNGRLLDAGAAGVELLNVLRPTVAVAVYFAFCAHALHFHPDHRDDLSSAAEQAELQFVMEVRRLYPFFPAVAARVRSQFTWRGWTFPIGVRAILDLFGTNRDPRLWSEPEQFQPRRFQKRDDEPFSLIPQGGGRAAAHHRCAGEDATIALMRACVRLLTRRIQYTVPSQSLDLQYTRLPALPVSGFVIQDVTFA